MSPEAQDRPESSGPHGDADLRQAAREEMDATSQQMEEELASMDHEALVRKYLELQRAYISALNAVMLFKRQMAAMQEHTIKTGQIAEFSRKINIADIDVIGTVAVRDVPLFFEAEYGALFVHDPDTRLLTLHRSWPQTLKQPALHVENDADTMLVHFLRTAREPMAVRSIEDYEARTQQHLRRIPADEPLAAGALLCPLFIGMQDQRTMLVGVLTVGGKRGGFTQHDVDLATMMSDMVATGISTSRLIDQMSHLAETDGLTLLYNHRHVQQEIDRAIAAALRYGTLLSLAMIDIDHFKIFNDNHGHQAGDHVLGEVARCIRMAVREQVDIPARYGGEEFMVVMPNTDLKGAAAAGERIRQAIAKAPIYLGSEAHRVTVSVGVAQFTPQLTKGMLIDAVDGALYRAKREGRNRVETVR